jgi:hypothetical protein
MTRAPALLIQENRVLKLRAGALAALGVMILALVSACSGADQVHGRPAENIGAGDYHLTVIKFENPASPPDRFTNPKPGNRFVKFDLTVANGGQQHLPVAASHFTMKDSAGLDYPAMPGVPTDGGLRVLSLSPGQEATTTLYFEMAANQTPKELVFAPAVVSWRTRITVDL